MATPLSLKRRRLDNATSKLTKPFVSPLRRPQGDDKTASLAKLNIQRSSSDLPYIPSVHAHTIRTFATPGPATASTSAAKTIRSGQGFATPRRTAPILRTTSSSKPRPAFFPRANASPSNAEEAQLRKAIAKLEIEIRETQTSIETLERAHRIRTSTKDSDLTLLIDKWRTASQLVAEELFGGVKERVYRMGGVGAWREAERAKFERVNEMRGGFGGTGELSRNANGGSIDDEEQDDRDCEFDEHGEELPPDEQEYRKNLKRQARQEMRDAADIVKDEREGFQDEDGLKKQKIWEEEGAAEDDTFTMDMMLRSLNIDLEVMGYDKELQKWSSS